MEEIGGGGWRREEKKVLYGRRLAKLDEDKVMADKLRMNGEIRWWDG